MKAVYTIAREGQVGNRRLKGIKWLVVEWNIVLGRELWNGKTGKIGIIVTGVKKCKITLMILEWM